MWTKIKSSLQLKYLTVIIGALIIGGLCVLVFNWTGKVVMRKIYLSQEIPAERVETLEADLVYTVNHNDKPCESLTQIHNWVKNHPGVLLFAYSSETGQLVYKSDGNLDIAYMNGESRTYLGVRRDYLPIKYKDTTLNIIIHDSTYQRYSGIVDLSAVLAGYVISLIVMLWIFKRTFLGRIITLSKQARAISCGDMEKHVMIKGSDELKRMSEDMEDMRRSIIEYYTKEQDAIKSNNELLTSISHDIRTPLTSIIGYSEMMADDKTNVEDMKKYAEICKDKAYRLKELTDTLFRYFYVYGREETDIYLEKYNAYNLFPQIFGERLVDIMQEGFEVQVPEDLDNRVFVNLDIDLFKRVVDNIFANLKKYAEKSKPIAIHGGVKDSKAFVVIENTIRKGENQAESTKIGLKTCSRAMAQMGGRFEIEIDGKIFRETIIFPVAK